VLHCRVCFPRRSRLQLDNQRAARPRCLVILLPMGCRTSSPTSPRRQGAPVHSSTVHHPGYNMQRCTPYVAVHPLRRATPVTSRCTRSEGVQCLRIGCTASHNKHNRGHSLPTHHNRQDQTQPHGLEILAPIPRKRRCTRYVAIHPIRRDAPDQKGCNAYGSGAPPHRQQACTWVCSLTPATPASDRPSPRSAAPNTAAMHYIVERCTVYYPVQR